MPVNSRVSVGFARRRMLRGSATQAHMLEQVAHWRMQHLLQSEIMLQFRILGPLEVVHDDGVVVLRGLRQRSLLAVLLLRVDEIVPTDSLLQALWGEQPPPSA